MAKPDKKLNIGVDWARHLRPKGKNKFWRKVRNKTKLAIRQSEAGDVR